MDAPGRDAGGDSALTRLTESTHFLKTGCPLYPAILHEPELVEKNKPHEAIPQNLLDIDRPSIGKNTFTFSHNCRRPEVSIDENRSFS